MASSAHTYRAASPPFDGVSALLERISELPPLEIEELQAQRRMQTLRPSNKRPLSDADLALTLFAEEAESLLNVSKDRLRDGRHDEEVLDELLQMEDVARYDHAVALALAEGRDPPPRPANLRRRTRNPVDGNDGAGLAAPNGSGQGDFSEPRFSRMHKGKAVQRYEEPETICEEAEEKWPPSACVITTQTLSWPSHQTFTSPLTSKAVPYLYTTTQRDCGNRRNPDGCTMAAHPSMPRLDEEKLSNTPVLTSTSLPPLRRATTVRATERSNSGNSEMPMPGAYGNTPPLAQDRPEAADRRVQHAVAEDPYSAETQRAPVFRSELGQRLSRRAVPGNAWATQPASSPSPPVSRAPLATPASAAFDTSKQCIIGSSVKRLVRRVTVSSPPARLVPVSQSSPPQATTETSAPDEMRPYPTPVVNAVAYVAAPRPALPVTRHIHASLESTENLYKTTGCLSVPHHREFTESTPSPSSPVETRAFQAVARARVHLATAQRVPYEVTRRSPTRDSPKAREGGYSAPARTLHPVASEREVPEPTARAEELAREVEGLRISTQGPRDLRPYAATQVEGAGRTICSPRAYAVTLAENVEQLLEAESNALVGLSMAIPTEPHFVSGGYIEREVTPEGSDDDALAPVEESERSSPIPVAAPEINSFAEYAPAPPLQSEVYETAPSPPEHATLGFSLLPSRCGTLSPPTPDTGPAPVWAEEGPLEIQASSSRAFSPGLRSRITSPIRLSASAVPAFPPTLSDRSASPVPEPSSYSGKPWPRFAPIESLPSPAIRAAPASPLITPDRQASPALSLYDPAPGSDIATCVICRSEVDDISDVHYMAVRVSCGHIFDMTCFQTMFLKATVDESLFPPKCCNVPIPLAEVERYLAPVLVDHFRRKTTEFTTANRVYCHNRRCSIFLCAATKAPAVLHCPRAECMFSTCGSCKQRAHPGAGCRPAGGADDAVLKLGKAAGWQRCYSCQHLIERDIYGCYHMTCRCGKEFCYLCGVPWKGCKCELFYVPPEEEEAAPVRVAAQVGRVGSNRPAAARAAPVPQAGPWHAGLYVRA